MKKQILIFTILTVFFFSCSNNKKNNTLLDEKKENILLGLKKAGANDIDNNMMLDPNSTPMYLEDLTLVRSEDFMKIMTSGEYIPEPYIDSSGKVQLFVLRKATEQEKMQMQNNMNDKNALIGKQAFDFSVTDIFEKKYTLENLKGKVIVINFWFIECKPCILEIPELNNLVDKYKDKNIVFIAFAPNNILSIQKFLKSKPFKYNIIADSKNIADLYNVSAFPTHLIIDKQSNIVYVNSGFSKTSINDLEKAIEDVITK